MGNLIAFLRANATLKKTGSTKHPIREICSENFGESNVSSMLTFAKRPSLVISDPKIVEAMYTSKNKFFDKNPHYRILHKPMFGDSILLAETTPQWREDRKAISPAFYKGKLENLIDCARESVRKSFKMLEEKIAKGGPRTKINLMDEFSNV